ncbi:MAG TPA: hypothetical protein VHK70_08450 [Burkholderiaceae bacterium]|nr:hypothetical protein [Burkholderiaceae bacterium]
MAADTGANVLPLLWGEEFLIGFLLAIFTVYRSCLRSTTFICAGRNANSDITV